MAGDIWEELEAATEFYQRAVNHHEQVCLGPLYRRGTEPEQEQARVARAEAYARHHDAVKVCAEQTVRGLICLVHHDPNALGRIWGEMGVPSAIQATRDELDAMRSEVEKMRQTLIGFRQAARDAQRELDKIRGEVVDRDMWAADP